MHRDINQKAEEMEDYTRIEWLDQSEWGIIKNIHIISDTKYGETLVGNILYKRDFTESYNCNSPEDEVDIAILYAIKELYPKSQVITTPLLLSTHKNNLKLCKNKIKVASELSVIPKLDDYSYADLIELKSLKFKTIKIPITVYTIYPKSYIHKMFNIKYPLDKPDLIDKIANIKFE